MNHRIRTFVATALILAFNFLIFTAMAQISPYNFGLREARDGVDRYWAMYNAHAEALAQGMEVSYEGIDTLDIELPSDYQTIPLGPHTDFRGLILYVTNNVRHGTLFSLESPSEPVALDKMLVDGGDFRDVPALANGDKLLILKDLHPWNILYILVTF